MRQPIQKGADENYFGGQRRYITEGNTEKAAKMLAELTGADLFQIEQKVPYAADYDTCIAQAKKDLQAGARPELVTLPDSLDEYDEIYLGYPNYWGTMPMQVFTFLEHCIHFWSISIFPERPSIRSAPMRAAD